MNEKPAAESSRVPRPLSSNDFPAAQVALAGGGEGAAEFLVRIMDTINEGRETSRILPLLPAVESLLADENLQPLAANALTSAWIRSDAWDKILAQIAPDAPHASAFLRSLRLNAVTGEKMDAAVPRLIELLREPGLARQAREVLKGAVLAAKSNVEPWLALLSEDLKSSDLSAREAARELLSAASVLGHSIPEWATRRLRELVIFEKKDAGMLPQFPDMVRVDDEISWTAAFDSWDEYNNNAYYLLTVYKRGRESARFFVRLDYFGADDNASIQERLTSYARDENTNTDYRGSMIDNLGL